jgi:hypothetical protein
LANPYRGAANLLAHVVLPIRRPFLVLANLAAESHVLVLKIGHLLLKAENVCLKIDYARLKRRD